MTFEKPYTTIATTLSICVLIETLTFTYMQQQGAVFFFSSSILYFLSGFVVCLLPLIPIVRKPENFTALAIVQNGIPYIVTVFFLFLLVYHIPRLIYLFDWIKITVKWADMLPTLDLGCRRFLAGKTIYGPMPEIFPTAIMPYLPMMWAPFLPAVICGFDMRWMTFIFQFIGVGLLLMPLLRGGIRIPILALLISGLGFFLFHNFFLYKGTTYWTMTEEGVVTGFYLFLSYAILRQNFWLIGLALTGCMLSRYSLIFWLPLYFGYILFSRSRADFIKLFLSFSLSILLLFILPFFIQDPAYFIHIPDTYIVLTPNFWHTHDLSSNQYFNVGFYKFFTVDQIHIMFLCQLGSSFIAPFIFLSICLWLGRKGRINARYIGWCSLKLSLLFFFCFIQIPYQYIFVPVTLISYVMLFDYVSGGGIDSEAEAL